MSGGFDDAFVAEVRDRNDIVSVVGDYVSLRKAGGQSYKGLCPFHNEKTASFNVHADRQFYYCFGCQAGGDVITFVRELNGYSFPEAIRHLAERAGMPVPEQRARQGDPRAGPSGPRISKAHRDNFYKIGALAQRFFHDTLQTMEGGVCRDYLRQRGIEKEAVDRFGLGFAPDRWDALIGALAKANVEPRLPASLGLIVPKKSGGGYYDRFRNRLTFPIRNVAGDVIGFAGRTLSAEKDVAKYVNSPDSPVFKKGESLYGLHEARRQIRKAGWVLVVEGQLDVVKVAQGGIEHVVAPMGTALTEAQCRLLQRFAPRVVLLYDGDSAGRAAAEKAIPLTLAEGISVAVAELPEGEDPDSFVGSHGIAALEALADHAIPGFEHLVLNCILPRTGHRKGAQDGLVVVREVAPLLSGIRDRTERELYRRKLADILGLDERELVRLLSVSPRRRARVGATSHSQAQAFKPNPVASTPPPSSELNLLMLLMLAPDATALYMAHDTEALLTHDSVRAACDALARRVEAEEPTDLASFLSDLKDPALKDALFRGLANAPPVGDAWATPFRQLVNRLRRDALKRRLEALKLDERRAYLSGDDAAAERVQGEKVRLVQQLENLRSSRG